MGLYVWLFGKRRESEQHARIHCGMEIMVMAIAKA